MYVNSYSLGICTYIIHNFVLSPSLSLYSTSSIPLTEYTLNVVNFVDAILNNNSTDDHINEFIKHGGLKPLLSLLSLPALPLTFPSSSACGSIAITCKSLLVS